MRNSRTRHASLVLVGLATGWLCHPILAAEPDKPTQDRPNVVLIVCDDLNDYVSGMDGHPQAATPSMAKLARTGVMFRRAYSNNPVCAPSRASFLTGIYPHTSGNLFFKKWFNNPVLKNSKTLMEHFRDNGYRVVGSGKLMHHLRKQNWTQFKHPADYGPFVYDGEKRVAHPSVPQPFRGIGAVDGSYASLSDVPYADHPGNKRGWIYASWKNVKPFRYVSATDRDPTPDERNAKWAAGQLNNFAKQKNKQPFFLAVGFIRPHTPLHVPQKFFDQFPLDDVKLPLIKAGDADDTHYRDVYDANVKGLKYFRLLCESYPDRSAAIRAWTQAYLASVAAADECVGQVIDAIDSSPLKDNTIVIVTSDHGWIVGAKDYLFKNALWEDTVRVPLIIRAPGLTPAGEVAEHPVSLIDLYPTLVDLCHLQGDTRKNEQGAKLDGHSLRPFLQNPKATAWDGPEAALTMIYAGENARSGPGVSDDPAQQHWSVRTRRWRYIRYNNGAEELYDHDTDPKEWNNVAANHPAITAHLKAQLRKMTGLNQIATHPNTTNTTKVTD